MNKEDIKSIFLIFLILLIIAAISVLGIKMYKNIIDLNLNENETMYQGNTIMVPKDEKNVLIVQTTQGSSNLNQIQSSNSENNTPITTSKEPYYYSQLDSHSKTIYNKLKSNKENLKSGTYKIDFGKQFNDLLAIENGGQLLEKYYQSAVETFLYDNPDVFYLDPTKMYINIQTTKKIFYTTYEVFIDAGNNSNYLANGYNSKQQILECENQINQEVQKILDKTNGKNEYEKIKVIHDYLIDTVVYDQSISKANIYNIYGALVNKESVCEGYAKAFKYLMDKIGVECVIVIGNATDSNSNTQSHAWNHIKFNGIWYAIDVTWDDPILIGGGTLSKKNRYKYFLKGSTTMNKDHQEIYSFIDNGKVYKHPILSANDYE